MIEEKNKGWIKLSRDITDHWLWSDEFSRGQAWIDLLLHASHSENQKMIIKGEVISWRRGQQIRSIKTLEKSWGWSRSKVNRFLELLEKDGMIERKGGHLTTIISICNYDSFQGFQTSVDTSVDLTVGHQSDISRATNKNVKKENNVIKDLSTDGEPPAKKDKKFNPDDVKLAEWFYEGLLELNPQHKKPNFETAGWADAIRLMREQDKRTYDQIAELYQWVHKDDFWKAQILSPKKLREKWDALWIKKQNPMQGHRDINTIDWATPLVEKIRSGKKRY